MSSSRVRLALIVLAATVITLWAGLSPYIDLWDHFPRGVDANKWVSQGHTDHTEWREWVFLKRHFVGYRPIAAGSFTLNSLMSGWQPWSYRVTDMLLHLGAGLSVLGLWMVLVPKHKAWGLLGLLLFFAHPAAENVVPHLARRSYLLATLFSTTALIAWVKAVQAPKNPHWMWLTGTLLSLAVLSNEVAVVVAVWMPLVALLWAAPVRQRLQQAALPSAILFLAVALRMRFIGHMGGYKKHYFAYASGGHNNLREMSEVKAWPIVKASWNYLTSPSSASGDPAWWATVPGGVEIVLVAAALVVLGAVIGIVRTRNREDALPLLLLVWIGGSVALFVISGNWFWRLGYAMITPYALLLTWAAHRVVTQWWPVRVLGLAAIGVLVWAPIANSPVLRGLDHGALRGQFKSNEVIRSLDALTANVEAPAVVWLVLPTNSGNSHQVLKWTRRLHPNLTFELAANSTTAKPTDTQSELFSLREVKGRTKVVLHEGMVWGKVPKRRRRARHPQELWLDKLSVPGGASFLTQPTDAGYTLVSIPVPAGDSSADPPVPAPSDQAE